MPAEIAPTELARRLAAGEVTYLLDVREPWEHARAALPQSVLVRWASCPARHRALDPPADALVVTICPSRRAQPRRSGVPHHAGLGERRVARRRIDAWSRVVDPAVPRY
jgi:rhodanese-related sulfurtransferase